MNIVPILGPASVVELLWGHVQQHERATALLHMPLQLKRMGLSDTSADRRKALESFIAECSAKEGFRHIVIAGFPADVEDARWLLQSFPSVVSFELKADMAAIQRHICLNGAERAATQNELAALEGVLVEMRSVFASNPHFLIHGIRAMREQSEFVVNRLRRPHDYARGAHAHLPAES
ncbi:MAG TPA: hypothetical protein VFQ72_00575 [Candidatus Paceibacterota bacterium]|nr:hypothetical protein [Candidatus Paceibacterota bacterium]